MLRIILTILISACTVISGPGMVLCDTGDYHAEVALFDHICTDHAVAYEIVSKDHDPHHHSDLPILFDSVSVPDEHVFLIAVCGTETVSESQVIPSICLQQPYYTTHKYFIRNDLSILTTVSLN